MTKLEISNGAGTSIAADRGPFSLNEIQNKPSIPSKSQIPQQNQQQQLLPQQHQQLQKQKVDLRNYHFASTTDEILRKYSKYPASLSLHIFDNHYRFNNSQDSQIIPKTSPMIKNFINHVLKEEIPVELSELLKDFSIKSYDGCLILQVYDHRNMIRTSTFRANVSPSKDAKNAPVIVSKPRTYRVLLRPTPLSLYYDLLYHTDSALTKFTDTLSLQMESEILALTKRDLDLSVKVNPYEYDYLKPDTDEMREGDKSEIEFSHRPGVEAPLRKIHQDELVLHKSSEYEELVLLLSNSSRRFEDTQEKKLVVVPPVMPSTSSTLSITTPPTKSTSKEGSVGADSKGKKGEKAASASSIPTTVAIPLNPVRTTGQFMRLRLIEEIRKKREIEKNQQEAKLQAQANSIQGDMVSLSNVASRPVEPMAPFATGSSQQPLGPPQVGDKRQQPGVQPAGKRARKDVKQHQVSVSNPLPAGTSLPQAPLTSYVPSNSNQQVPSINNNMQLTGNPGAPPPQQQQQQQQQPPTMSLATTPHQIPMGTPNLGPGALPPQNVPQAPTSMGQHNLQSSLHLHQVPSQPSLQQQQHQQIFQGSLTPEEQQVYKQIQQKMNALVMMSQTGVAPNGQQLSPQQKQQAMQQVKILQQQLLQKFPVYFQRLKQFQLYQKQKQLQQQQQQQQQQQRAIASGGGIPNLHGQFDSNLMQPQQQHFANPLPQGVPSPNVNSQPLNASTTPAQSSATEPKKKRVYKRKVAK